MHQLCPTSTGRVYFYDTENTRKNGTKKNIYTADMYGNVGHSPLSIPCRQHTHGSRPPDGTISGKHIAGYLQKLLSRPPWSGTPAGR